MIDAGYVCQVGPSPYVCPLSYLLCNIEDTMDVMPYQREDRNPVDYTVRTSPKAQGGGGFLSLARTGGSIFHVNSRGVMPHI